MPLIDMPLEELYQYQGTNKKPVDFDAYWDKGLQEMEALGTDFTLERAELQVPGIECYHLYYHGVGGARIHAKFLLPIGKQGPIPAITIFHGYNSCSISYTSLLKYAAGGFAVAAMDCRGQQGYSEDIVPVKGYTWYGHIIRGIEDQPEKLYFRNTYLDCAQLVRILMAMPQIDETRVGAAGASQGGGLTLACAALTPKLNRAAVMIPFLSDYRRVWDMDLAKDAYNEIHDWFRFRDPLHQREDWFFERLGYIDNQHLAPRTRCKVKMMTGLMDTVCPPSTQFSVYNKLKCEKEVLIYPDFGHEYPPGYDDVILSFMLEMLEQ